METKTKNEEIENAIRSEEVQELMERMPSKMIKWGSGAVVFLILLLVALSAIIQYPDTISGTALLTTKQPPIAIVSKTTGIIEKLFVTDKSAVKEDEPLAILKNRTHYSIVFWIDSVLNTSPKAAKNSNALFDTISADALNYSFWMRHKDKFDRLGEITYSFSGFINSLKDFNTVNTRKITFEEALNGSEGKKLYDKAWFIITQLERLKSSIGMWKDRYLLKAPVAGFISFQTQRVENQELQMGDELCQVISADKEIICKMRIPITGAAKVKPGQRVRIVLASYPENEFGFIEGFVKAISSIPVTEETIQYYVVAVEVPQPIITSVKKEITYMPEMQGTADIITEKKTILMRLTDVFINYWKKAG